MHKRQLTSIIGIGLLVAAAALFFLGTRNAGSRRASNACINNLRNIAGAKAEWQLENKKQLSDVATWYDIQPYMGRGTAGTRPQCPDGGVYTIGRLGHPPTCSYGGIDHTLPAD